jgi:hypothetical protein
MLKKPKHIQAHVARTRLGQGDYYGRGYYPTRGKVRGSYVPNVAPLAPKKLKQPPKTLA